MTSGMESGPTARLARYIATAGGRPLPDEVTEKAGHHLLDTIGAMVSGSDLRAGRLAMAWAQAQGGAAEATVVATRLRTTAFNAALANGLMAHADETDDSHAPSLTHPGCAIVPAALSVAERVDASGEQLLRAVVLGYDVCTRLVFSVGRDATNERGFSTHAIGGLFGATAACASLLGLDERQVRYALSYACQCASGVRSWNRDEAHVEKAYVFGGMPASNGVLAATMVAAGFSGVDDPLDGPGNLLDVLADGPDRTQLAADLGDRYEIMHANIKKWPVGSPIQAALDSTLVLIDEHGLTADDVDDVTVRLPSIEAGVVDNRSMPDIWLQHMVALMLVDGDVTFASSQDYERIEDPAVAALRARVTLVPDTELSVARPRRQGIVTIATHDGREMTHHTKAVKGTADAPMTRQEVEAKVRGLLEPVLDAERTERALAAFGHADRLASVREAMTDLAAGEIRSDEATS
jgi:2-methylcitrate dehydratase PrpD